VVEMSLKAAMFRTFGVSEEESIGSAAHDILEFVRRLRNADANTEEQRKAQRTPGNEVDGEWLKKAYLNARYPKPWSFAIPAELYTKADAERAIKLADEFVRWAAQVEDLPDLAPKAQMRIQRLWLSCGSVAGQLWFRMEKIQTSDLPVTAMLPLRTVR